MEHIELIEAYFGNNLSQEEKESFRRRLQTDEAFATEVEHYQLITRGIIQLADEASLQEKMERWDNEDAALRSRSILSFTPWKVAAVLVPVLLISGLFYYFSTSPTSNQDLFVAYFSPYEDVLSSRSSTTGSFEAAMNAYNSEAYNEAIPLFNKAITEEKVTDKITFARFYQAMAYLSVGDTEHAEQQLNQVSQADNPLLQEVSQWYLLLIYLKTDRTILAEEQLTRITNNPDHLYFRDVSELKDDWDNPSFK